MFKRTLLLVTMLACVLSVASIPEPEKQTFRSILDISEASETISQISKLFSKFTFC